MNNRTHIICTTCKRKKSVKYFRKRKDRPCGYESKCRRCRIIAQALYGASPEGKAKRRAYRASPSRKEAVRRYEENPARKEAKKAWRESKLGKMIRARATAKARMKSSKTEFGRNNASNVYNMLTRDIEKYRMRYT
jgi:hypothetical protein